MRVLSSLFLFALSVCTSVHAQVTHQGALPGGAGSYRIMVPNGWQAGGPLIVYSHGFSMSKPAADDPPSVAPSSTIRDYLLSRGYALAAGSFRTRGWALFDLAADQRALLTQFRAQVGMPGDIILVGGSLGGVASMKTAEAFVADGEPVSGVYALCAPMDGARTWDQAVDVRLLFDAVCPDSPLPTSDTSLPWVLAAQDIPDDIDNIEDPDVLVRLGSAANRIRQCTGMFQPSVLDTDAQRQRRARLKSLLHITEDDWLKTNLAYAIYPLAELIRAPDKLAGRNAFDNTKVDYGDAEINARVRRVQRDPLAAVRLRGVSNPNGRVGGAEVLALHTTRDELVFPEHLTALQQLGLPDTQLRTALVQEDEPAHCAFSSAEFVTGFEALRRWSDGGAAPTAATLKSDCETLRASVGASERCGFDPAATVPSLDAKVRPRELATASVDANHSGTWFDPAFDGEGFVIEVLDNGRDAVVGWYTYPPAGGDGQQRWIAGLGTITEDGIHVADAREFRGPPFGANFDAGQVTSTRWGELDFWFDGCGSGDTRHPQDLGVGRMAYRGPAAYGTGERALMQLSYNVAYPTHCRRFFAPPNPHPLAAYTGTWYRGPQASGDGVIVQIQEDGAALVAWYTYDPQGRPAWLVGSTMLAREATTIALTLQRPRGTLFGTSFDADDVQRPAWGTIELRYTGCDSAELRWQPTEAGWSAGTTTLQRLTHPAGLPACDGAP